MKAEWMDDDESKVVLHLDAGEVFGDFAGPGSFQLVANDLNSDFARLEEMKVEIADPPEPAGLSEAQKATRDARKKAAKEQRAEAKKRAEEAKAAAAKAAEAKPAAAAQHAGNAQHGAQHAAPAKK